MAVPNIGQLHNAASWLGGNYISHYIRNRLAVYGFKLRTTQAPIASVCEKTNPHAKSSRRGLFKKFKIFNSKRFHFSIFTDCRYGQA
jgi:hypothetical protein